MRNSLLLIIAAASALSACSLTQNEAIPLSSSQPLDETGTEAYQRANPETGSTNQAVEWQSGPSTIQPASPPDQTSDQQLVQPNEPLRMAYEAQRSGAYPEMIDLFEQAAAQGSVHAHYELARFYLQGKFAPKNPQLAVDHLQQANALGYGQATRVLAWLYLKGEAVPKNIEYGTQLMESATVGSVRAKREAGLLFSNIYQPHLNDPAKGRMYLEQAYEAGDAEAAYYMHQILAREGYQQAAQQALNFAASQGFSKALAAEPARPQASQAPVDAETRAERIKMAALKGDTDAMYQYANNVLLGRFPSIDKDLEAYAWFSIAAERSEPRAQQELAALDGVRKILDREQPGRVSSYIADIRSAISE